MRTSPLTGPHADFEHREVAFSERVPVQQQNTGVREPRSLEAYVVSLLR